MRSTADREPLSTTQVGFHKPYSHTYCDEQGALEYAARLASLAREVEGELLVVMNYQLFTPVTPSTGPWPGFLYDPERDGSYQINSGPKLRSNLCTYAHAHICTYAPVRSTPLPGASRLHEPPAAG